ncbi:MAG: universal stress protein [Candidatus Rokubacteria bacterium]|nr:universal stress protein [Candidatus Rokubacteria bacterium]
MYERVLVPLDGSPVAEAILPFIEQIAGPLDMEIVLLRVVPLSSADVVAMAEHAGAGEPILKELDAQAYLEPLVATLKAKGVRAGARVRIGDPSIEIAAAAKEIGADLIAMTTHGRSGLGRLLFGSVAEAVLRSAPIPVFLMRVTETALRSAGLSGARGKRS